MEKARLFLVDASAYIYRAFYAIRGLSSPSGMSTNAIYGFYAMLQKLIKKDAPEYMAVVMDSPGPGIRHEIDPQYKANRKKMPEELSCQIPYIQRILAALNLVQLQGEGFEADDIIAALVAQYASHDLEIFIVGIDKDLLQLVSPNVFMLDVSKSRVMGEEHVMEKYGLTPSRLVDYQALTGDSVDNIPGVKGVGKKTAAKLLGRFQDIDEIYARLDEIENKKLSALLAEHKDAAYRSRKLAKLSVNFPHNTTLDALKTPCMNKAALFELFDELGFKNMKKLLEDDPG